MSGFMVPKWLAKSQFVWNDSFWRDYRRVYISSRTPTSDMMAEKEIQRLLNIVSLFPEATIAGQSLGAWWAANLACRPQCKIKRMVFWTPLGDTTEYPIFNVSQRYHPINQTPKVYGPHRILVYAGKEDFIVPPKDHAETLCEHFSGTPYLLHGGHFFQTNHQEGLKYMKTWMELK